MLLIVFLGRLPMRSEISDDLISTNLGIKFGKREVIECNVLSDYRYVTAQWNSVRMSVQESRDVSLGCGYQENEA